MSKEKSQICLWKGCGATKDITGCRFYISPMSDNYAEMLVSAISRVNTAKVWSTTDITSTVYRGKRVHVLDCVKACFSNIHNDSTHITMEATFTKGCPGDDDSNCFLAEDDKVLNNAQKKFDTVVKISFYPLGINDYMDHIGNICNLAIRRGLYTGTAHYVSYLEGDINDIFDYFNEVLEYSEKNISHYVLEATFSVNSPSEEKKI